MNDRKMAVVYPLKSHLIRRFLADKKDVFVKYVTHQTPRLRIGDKLLFYRTKSDKKIVGEGTITNIDFLNAEEVLAKYKDRVFLNKEELAQYSGYRTKKMLTFELDNFREYNNPISASKMITMSGLYLRLSEYAELMNKI